MARDSGKSPRIRDTQSRRDPREVVIQVAERNHHALRFPGAPARERDCKRIVRFHSACAVVSRAAAATISATFGREHHLSSAISTTRSMRCVASYNQSARTAGPILPRRKLTSISGSCARWTATDCACRECASSHVGDRVALGEQFAKRDLVFFTLTCARRSGAVRP